MDGQDSRIRKIPPGRPLALSQRPILYHLTSWLRRSRSVNRHAILTRHAFRDDLLSGGDSCASRPGGFVPKGIASACNLSA